MILKSFDGAIGHNNKGKEAKRILMNNTHQNCSLMSLHSLLQCFTEAVSLATDLHSKDESKTFNRKHDKEEPRRK